METISYFTNATVPVRYTKIDGKKLYLQQFVTLLLKRFHHYRRNLRVFVTNIILPCLFVAISMAFTTIKPTQVFQPKILVSPEIYKPNDIFFAFGSSKDVFLDQIYNDYRQLSKSVCNQKESRYYSDEILTRQSINSYLCNFAPSDVSFLKFF